MKKKTVMIKVSYLVELREDEIKEVDGTLDKIKNNLSKDFKLKLDNHESITLGWECTSSIVLEPDNMNCGRCSNCNSWLTNKEKENSIEGLCYGASVDGKLLCDECLPPNHPWAF